MTDFRLTRTTSLYRWLLTLILPKRFHARYAHQMLDVFAELDAAEREEGGVAGAWRALGAEVPGLLRLASRERRAEHEASRSARRSAHTLALHSGIRKATVLEPLMQDFDSELLDVLVHLAHPLRVGAQRLQALLTELRQHEVLRHSSS